MAVSKVNFNNCYTVFNQRYDEIFLLKDSKLYFALFGSNIKDGVVDGAKSKWKNIAFLDGLITIAVNQCPVGHRTLRRPFNQYKCIIQSVKYSLIDNQSINTIIPKVYDNIELYDFPYYFHSARNVIQLLLPNYRNSILCRNQIKLMILFTSQLQALLPANFHVNPNLKGASLLDYLIAKVDEQDLYFKAINTAIKISLESDVDDNIHRCIHHTMIYLHQFSEDDNELEVDYGFENEFKRIRYFNKICYSDVHFDCELNKNLNDYNEINRVPDIAINYDVPHKCIEDTLDKVNATETISKISPDDNVSIQAFGSII